MTEQSRTVVKIFDHQYRIGSASADAGAIEQAAAFLDERMRRIAGNMKRRVPLEVAILAAMEIADEVLRFRDRREQLLSEADERISRFTRELEDKTAGSDDPPAPRF
jgi:cell division protein ZapA (FtsZ GTPase activity inhibitor)